MWINFSRLPGWRLEMSTWVKPTRSSKSNLKLRPPRLRTWARELILWPRSMKLQKNSIRKLKLIWRSAMLKEWHFKVTTNNAILKRWNCNEIAKSWTKSQNWLLNLLRDLLENLFQNLKQPLNRSRKVMDVLFRLHCQRSCSVFW